MKKLNTIILILLFISGCKNNSLNKDKEGKTQELDDTIEQLSTANEDHIFSDSQIKVQEEVKPINQSKKTEIEGLKSKYKHLRAKFVSTDSGDLFYYNFKDEKGKEYSFSYVKDKSYELLIDDESSDFGEGINPKYKNKYFDIFYQVEKHDLRGWGEKHDYDVVIKMILAE
jgi:hypothetical protein